MLLEVGPPSLQEHLGALGQRTEVAWPELNVEGEEEGEGPEIGNQGE